MIAVDAALEQLIRWRATFAEEIARRSGGCLRTEAAHRFLDRVMFARILEARGFERVFTLGHAVDRWEHDAHGKHLYSYLTELFQHLAARCCGGLFASRLPSEDATLTDDEMLRALVGSLYCPEVSHQFDTIPIEMLGAVHERSLGHAVADKPDRRHSGGIYYTPRYIVDAIVERTLAPLLEGATPRKALKLRIVDPACGSGSFLLGVYQYLVDWHLRYYAATKDPGKDDRRAYYANAGGRLRLTLQRKRDILTNCIHGLDIDAQAVHLAQMSLYLKLTEDEAAEPLALQRSLDLFQAERYLPDLSRNIQCGNSLVQTHDLESRRAPTERGQERINAFDWEAPLTGFGNVVRDKTAGGRGGFDAVIGNPPYVRVQSLVQWAPDEVDIYKERYASVRAGNYDLYVVFIEKSLQLLRPGGRLGYIVPTKWWHAGYGAPLRRLLAEQRPFCEILDFAHEQVFEDPTTYTCISLFTKKRSSGMVYRRLSPAELHVKGDAAAPLFSHSLSWNELGNGPWYPGVRQHVRKLFERLRRTGPFLGDPEICSRVFQGLKTSLDSVYVMDLLEEQKTLLRVRSKALDRELWLERALLRPLVKGREMKRFTPLRPRKVLLFPYRLQADGASLLTPDDLTRRAPQVWQYLLNNKQTLQARERGRFKGSDWYQFGRNQALDVVCCPKLLTADLADKMAFSLDAEGELFLLGGAAGGYGLLPAKPEYQTPLLALLNSKLLEWMLRPPGLSSPFRGGWFSCEARFINLLPIRLPQDPKELDALARPALRAVEAYRRLWQVRADRDKALIARQIEALEGEMDDRVFHLYQVTPDERREIEELVTEARQACSAQIDTVDPTNAATADPD